MKRKISVGLKIRLTFAALALIISAPASAAEVAIDTADANGWILENYTSGPVVIWYTGAVCENGSQSVSLPNPPPGEVNRLWATVMASKAASKKIFIRYDNKSCAIVSFGFR